ncbi:hypothetical protein [Streptomyces sp. TLI_171]|uniref:hypothetical protein n=1 Tax=Streptomyces sp. TLI_171 TaxID=1938859 RepID=UPI000C6B21AE|nr:hypothetical protein [Streptomyces sp. TLI_171]RKE22996.1 hypothetical protein BX266_6452 [Streptomyces sp. TLI_171]
MLPADRVGSIRLHELRDRASCHGEVLHKNRHFHLAATVQQPDGSTELVRSRLDR